MKKVSNNFLNDQSILNDINSHIVDLEINEKYTDNIDEVYSAWCKIVKNNMSTSIPHKIVNNNLSGNYRKHRHGKQWWNESLTDLWANLCFAEKIIH